MSAEVDESRLQTPIVHIITTGGTIASRIDLGTGIGRRGKPLKHCQSD